MDTNVINYRFVVNDAVCKPWEPMPEINGTDLASLVDYLKICSAYKDILGELWDPSRLKLGNTWDKHIVSYGERQQFYLPTIPNEGDFCVPEKVSVECCGETLEVYKEWDAGVCPDLGYILYCEKCGRHTNNIRGTTLKSPQSALDRWNLWYTSKTT